MKCLSWNCRGLGNPRTVRQLLDIVSRFKPEIVFLMEVKTSMENMERIKCRLKFERFFFVEGKNRGGYHPSLEGEKFSKIAGIFQ